MPKYFVTPDSVKDNEIFIEGDDAKHIGTVLRAKTGDRLTVCDGFNRDYECVIKEIEKTKVTLSIESQSECNSEPKLKITLFQALPKADKMELIIQKCTEIGVCQFVPVSTERAVVKIDKKDKSAKKTERWQKIAESAAKQSGRGIIPYVHEPVSFGEALKMASLLDGAIIPYELEEKNGIREFVESFKGKSLGIFIGPEGGFAQSEIEKAIKDGIKPITLGKRILRTETAGMVTAAILIYELG